MKTILKYIVSVSFLLMLSACTTTGEPFGFTPKVYSGDDVSAKITRGAYHTTFDTAVVASAHCAKYKKLAVLVEEVNIWEIPNTDKYACVLP
jgi:hypothetical protein|tara:strand:+ start:151 stop:426 length:276 start_codon:yes stop_codon:yes gene_type:complete